jgi:hypothetical protein
MKLAELKAEREELMRRIATAVSSMGYKVTTRDDKGRWLRLRFLPEDNTAPGYIRIDAKLEP